MIKSSEHTLKITSCGSEDMVTFLTEAKNNNISSK